MIQSLQDPLFRAWGLLVALSATGTVLSGLALSGVPAATVGLALLALAFWKAKLILLAYLGLAKAPSWTSGGTAAIMVVCLLLGGLYLAA